MCDLSVEKTINKRLLFLVSDVVNVIVLVWHFKFFLELLVFPATLFRKSFGVVWSR